MNSGGAMSSAIFFGRPLSFLRRSRLLLEERGVAAVEFSLILPIMVLLWIGGVEITGALSLDRRLNTLASSMGDLVARTKTITYDQVEDIFNLSSAALYPYSDTDISMRITAVDIDEDGNATVAWSRARGTGLPAYAKETDVNADVPAALRPEDNVSQLIMAEVKHIYSPAVGYVISGDIELEDRMFFVPRLTNQVKICPTAEITSCVTTI